MTGDPARFLVLAAALLIDRIVGDPAWLWARMPHPVALFGRAVDALDARLNRVEPPFPERRRRGVFALALLVAAGAAGGLAIELVLISIPFGVVLSAAFASILFAQKSLVDHVAAVAEALASRGLAGGREAVARIVGRDVSTLDEAGVARAAIESAAENFSDGVVTPAFWYLLLGLPGLIVFKLVNTADSMIGNRSPRHEAFGWASARLDDALNFVPARISAALIAGAALLSGHDARAAVRVALRDARLHKSPNAGWPEAAAAGALGLALGGPRRYGDIGVDGAWLNPSGRGEATGDDIRATLRLIDKAWAMLLALSLLIALWSAL